MEVQKYSRSFEATGTRSTSIFELLKLALRQRSKRTPATAALNDTILRDIGVSRAQILADSLSQ